MLGLYVDKRRNFILPMTYYYIVDIYVLGTLKNQILYDGIFMTHFTEGGGGHKKWMLMLCTSPFPYKSNRNLKIIICQKLPYL